MHIEKHQNSPRLLRDIVIGMSDGLTVPFALAAGLSGAISSARIVTTAGLAEIAAGSIAMGLGGYLASKTDADHYSSELKREYNEVERIPEQEKAEVMDALREFGISEGLQRQFAEELAKDKNKWVDFMMRYELGLEAPLAGTAMQSALAIGGSYVVGGIVPLLPYFFVNDARSGLWDSCIITACCLVIFGYFKSRMTGQPVVQGSIRVLFTGLLAAATAFALTRLIGQP